ncbi:MAG: citrulline utilization hydrolase CtlX [Flavicella sp.]
MKQTTNTILMVRPATFRKNEETAVNNYYQLDAEELTSEQIQKNALFEFDSFVSILRDKGITVIVANASTEIDTPDAIFPNNWVSFHANGNIGLYPMFAPNRRLERKESILQCVESSGFTIDNIIDYSSAEEEGIFLEGTGSIVLDRENRKAYCAISPRSDEELFVEFCEDFEYTPVVFTANQTVEGERAPIYHTNVMLCVAKTFAVICLASIDDKKERKQVKQQMKQDGKELIVVSEEQLTHFAGNMLQVENSKGELFLVMSASAKACLTQQQIDAIEKHCEIISANLSTIEKCGGGSARCMMAEVFLPKVTT